MAKLIGIVNITPDSFSDGGLYEVAEKAAVHAQEMVQQGAALIDIGAESTRPDATPLTAEEEWQRLEPVLKALQHTVPEIPLSIDTYHPETAEKCMSLGVAWINDVSGLTHPDMITLAANSNAQWVVMHNLGIPANRAVTLPEDSNPVEQVFTWAEEKIQALGEAGLSKEQIIFDPGIGFGKTAQQSLALVRAAARFKALDVPIMVGHSRKSFMTLFTDKSAQERDPETAAISAYLAGEAIDYLRVHNVAENKKALEHPNDYPLPQEFYDDAIALYGKSA